MTKKKIIVWSSIAAVIVASAGISLYVKKWFPFNAKKDGLAPPLPSKVQTGNATDKSINATTTLALIKEVYTDANMMLTDAQLAAIASTLATMPANDMAIEYAYFYNINQGLPIDDANTTLMNGLIKTYPAIILPVTTNGRRGVATIQVPANATNAMAKASPFHDAGQSGAMDVMDGVFSAFGIQGLVLDGLAHALCNLFCGSNCQRRRAERANR